MSLNLKEAVEPSTKDRFFDNIEAVKEIVDPVKVKIFLHKAEHIYIIAAKETGKSAPVNWWKIYGMEKDPKANVVTLQKYTTAATKKGFRTVAKALNDIKTYGFKLKRNFAASDGNYYRLARSGQATIRDPKTRLDAQFIHFDSFEDSDRLSDFAVSNGGYVFLIHIEEPVQANDNHTPKDDEWKSSFAIIVDSIKRTYKDYKRMLEIKRQKTPLNQQKHLHEPLPFKVIATLNDWDPNHYISKTAERFFPVANFLNWVLGFDYASLRELWLDKIDGTSAVPVLQEQIDKQWESIKPRILTHHTQMVYVEKDKFGVTIDALYVRMQKFANPRNREVASDRNDVYEEMYNALVTGDSLRLAKAFGTGYDGDSNLERFFNFNHFKPIDTDKKLKEPGRRILLFSIGIDYDANRGPVLTPFTISAVFLKDNPFGEWKATDYKGLIHEQLPIQGYGRGPGGAHNKIYQEQIIDGAKFLYNKYVNEHDTSLIDAKQVWVDDDAGTFVPNIDQQLFDIGFWTVDIVKKHGDIESGGFGINSRDQMMQRAIDAKDIEVDRRNKDFIYFLKNVPVVVTPGGTRTRTKKGRWGTRFKDLYDSSCYAFYGARESIYAGFFKNEVEQ